MLGTLPLPALLFAADPFVGVWKMNPAKSVFAGTPPVSIVMRFEAGGDNELNYSDEIVAKAEGPLLKNSGVMRFDGAPQPALNPQMIAVRKRSGINLIEAIVMPKQGPAHYLTYTIFAGGNELTVLSRGRDSRGEPYTNTVVLERQ